MVERVYHPKCLKLNYLKDNLGTEHNDDEIHLEN